MAEVLITYEAKLAREGGTTYTVQACGRPLSENQWEGWLEFLPEDGSEVLRTRRETTQPNLQDLEYWASGIERVYLEGALQRALAPERVVPAPPPAEAPVYDGPAPERSQAGPRRGSVLDPYHIHQSQGDEVLRRQLSALELWQLRGVAVTHTEVSEAEADGMDRQELTRAILEAVRR